jgi:hypothetical protein
MWGIVLLLGLSVAADPIRLGIAMLLTSRPRPFLNLVAFWSGAMVAGLTFAIGTFVLLKDVVPALIAKAVGATGHLTGGQGKLVFGVILLVFAAVGTVRLIRRPALVPEGTGDPSVWVEQPPKAPKFPALSELVLRARRLLNRGNPWISFIAGLSQGPTPVEYLAVIAVVHASGASVPSQVGASIVFTVAMLAILEVVLISYVVHPARTQSVLNATYNWLRTYRHHILIVIAGISGIILLTS